MFRRWSIFALLLIISFAHGKEIMGGASSASFYCGSHPAPLEMGLTTMLSSGSVSPQFMLRYYAFEFYIGATVEGTIDTLWANARKYKMYSQGFYLAEIDSYSFELNTYMIEPEIGLRIYFTPKASMSPYINLGAFLIIPIMNHHYKEEFIHYDSLGNLLRTVENTSESGPELSILDIYELGLHGGIGMQYRINENFAVFGEFAIRAIFGGAEVKYDYISDVLPYYLLDEQHLWQGGGDLSVFSTDGFLGLQFYW